MTSSRVMVLGGGDYVWLFKDQGWVPVVNNNNSFNTNMIDDVDLICFTGGTDINPELYEEERHQRTAFTDVNRDTVEVDIFEYAVSRDIPMVGICRGAQFGCAMSGGKVIQHVNGHHAYHTLYLYNNHQMQCSSDHHQMMNPGKADHILLGWSEGLSKTYEGMQKAGIYKHKLTKVPSNSAVIEPEVVYFPKTRFLCHQPHPEWMKCTAVYPRYFHRTIKEFLNVG